MRRALSVKRLACLVLAFLVLAPGAHFLHGFQVRRNARTLLQHATRAEEQGNVEQAVDYLKRYTALAPTDVEGLARYGLALDKLYAKTKSANVRQREFYALEAAVRRDASRQELRRRLIDVAMDPRLARFKDAREHIDILLGAAPKDPELEQLKARCLEFNKEYEKAVTTYQEAIAHAQERVERTKQAHDRAVKQSLGGAAAANKAYEEAVAASLGQLDSYVRCTNLKREKLNKEKEADALLDLLVERHPGAYRAYVARARYLAGLGGKDQEAQDKVLGRASADLAKARRLAADDMDVLLESAEVARRQNKLDEAGAHLQRCLEHHPRKARPYIARAQLELQAGKPDKAAECLHSGLNELKADAEAGTLHWALADLLVGRGEPAEAGKHIALLRKGGSSPAFDYLDGRVFMAKGEWQKAAALLERAEPLLERSPDWEGLANETALLLAQCYERLGAGDRCDGAYRRAQARARAFGPVWVRASLGLGATLSRMNRIEDALEMYQRVLPHEPGVGGVLARLLILRNYRLPPQRRDWREVKQLLDRLVPQSQDSAELPILRAEVFAAEDDMKSARDVLVTARDKAPKQVELWVALATLAEREGKPEQALATFDEAGRKLGDRVELRLARARFFTRREDPKAREAIAALAQGLEKFAEGDQELVLRGVGQALVRAGDLAAAGRVWAEVDRRQQAKGRPDLFVLLVLFDLAHQAKDDTAADLALQRLKGLEGAEGTLWRYGKVVQLMRRAKTKDREAAAAARSLLAEISNRRPEWGRVPALEGELDELDGRPEQALPKYERAFELNERSPVVIGRLVEMLSDRKRFAEADRVVRKLEDQAALSGDLQRLMADISFQNQDYGQARELAKKAVAADSKNYREHLWLGRILWADEKHRAEAGAALDKAAELAPDKPEVWVAVIGYLVETGSKDKAAERLKEAVEKHSLGKTPLALATCYALLGRLDDAQKVHEDALKAQPEDADTLRAAAEFYLRRGQTAEAESCLKKVIDLGDKKPAEAAWARRLLTLVHVAAPDYQKSQQAVAELNGLKGAGDRAPEEAAQNERTRALVLGVQRDLAHRREAIRLLEKMKEAGRLSVEDKATLAQIYDSVGDWSKARGLMQSTLATNRLSPVFLAQMARGFLRHKDVAGAGLCLAQLEKAVPRALPTLALKAQLLKEEGKQSEAIRLLTDYAKQADASPGQVAAALEPIDGPAAEGLYRKYVAESKKPEAVLVLVGYFARQNRLDAALDLCERAWLTCAPELAASACVNSLYTGQPTPRQCERVERWLIAAQEKGGGPELSVELANLRNIQGRYPDAEALYRKAIAGSKPSPEALNNLAWLLALQGGNGREALVLLQRAAALSGPVPALLDTRGVARLRLGEVDQALQDFQDAAAQQPTASTYFHLCQAYLAAKKPDDARAALRKAEGLGLKAESLHPLERPAYRQVLEQFR